MADRIDSLPVRAGFRMRGMAMSRMETFTDAAFAFAVSLLVLSNDPFGSFEDLRDALMNAPAFVFSMGILMIFWVGHRTYSRRYGLDDGLTVGLSWMMVLVLLLYVFPLHFVGLTFYTWLLWQATGVIVPNAPSFNAARDLNELFAIYASGFTLLCLLLAGMFAHALRRADELELSELERHDTRGSIVEWSVVGGVGLLSFVLALALPPSALGIPGWVYMLLPVVMPIFGMRHGKRRRAIMARA